MFFYGSLRDPDVLQAILGLPEAPSMRTASITHFKMKMWSVYPTLIPSTSASDVVKGTVYRIEEEQQFERLQRYETAAYTWTFCEVSEA